MVRLSSSVRPATRACTASSSPAPSAGASSSGSSESGSSSPVCLLRFRRLCFRGVRVETPGRLGWGGT